MVHNIESVYRQSILSIQYNGEQSDFWLMSHLPLSCNKRTNKIQKEEKKQIFGKEITLNRKKILLLFKF